MDGFMKVTATRPVWIESDGKKVLLNKGDSAEVDGRTYGDSHVFIAGGYLVAEKSVEAPKRRRKQEQDPEE